MDTVEITIQHNSGDHWPVVLEYTQEGKLPRRAEGRFEYDHKKLVSLALKPGEYGALLGKALFQETVRDVFVQAREKSRGRLRVLLVVEAPDLRSLRWGRLCAPLPSSGDEYDFLALDQHSPFSLYLPSLTDRYFPPIGPRDLKALLLVAGPPEKNKYRLASFNAGTVVEKVRESLGKIQTDVLANSEDAVGLPIPENLYERIKKEHYTLLHIVAHGKYDKKSNGTFLYLLDKDQQVSRVSDEDLIKHLRKGNVPHFVFLSACESAAPKAEAEKNRGKSDETLGGLAQKFVRELY